MKYYNKQHGTTFVITSHYTKDIQEMCKRVFVLHKGQSIYDGNFNTLIKSINPDKKLIFEFFESPSETIINNLEKTYKFQLHNNILTSTMPEVELQKLLKILLEKGIAKNISFEDLPVDDSMRSYFENPDKYIK